MTRYRVNPELPNMLGKRKQTIAGFCRAYNVPLASIRASLNPKHHTDRQGGILLPTAWALAHGWQALINDQATTEDQKITEDEAFKEVIVTEVTEETDESQQRPALAAA